MCSRHFDHYRKAGENFLQHTVTGDETWVHLHIPETKWKSIQWKYLPPPVAKKFKIMLTVFWDSYGPTLETCLEHGTIWQNLQTALKEEGHC
jgi:hypothetical protein